MTPPDTPPSAPRRRPPPWWLPAVLTSAIAALLPGCRTAPGPQAPPGAPAAAPRPSATPAPQAEPAASDAGTARAYRKDAASHLYTRNPARIFQGRLPPLLYAVGVLEVDIDRNGLVKTLRWLRAPRHAPEVVAEIERLARAAAPYPRPARLGRVTYTDTWLWDASGRFQLDTLTEGQD